MQILTLTTHSMSATLELFVIHAIDAHLERRRSGLKVRPLLRTAYQPKQKQPQQLRKSSKPQQPADSSQHSDSQHTQNRASSKQLQASPHAADQSANGRAMPGSTAATAEATAELAHLSLQSPSTCDVDSQSAPHEASDHDQSHHQHQGPPSEGPADASGSATREQAGQSQQSSKGRKAKKSKRDYAAWAGATAETRALATAHHDGNPDLEPPVVPSARPRIIKQSEQPQFAILCIMLWSIVDTVLCLRIRACCQLIDVQHQALPVCK